MRKLSGIAILLFFLAAMIPALCIAGGTINAGTDDWPPYYGQQLENKGYVTEIVTEAFKRGGWEYKVKFMNWNRAVALCKQGKLDMIQGAYLTEERKKEFLVTDPYASVDVVFIKKKGSDITYSALEDLKGKKIGLVRGYAYPEAVTQADFLDTEMAEKLILNIKKLLAGRIDLVIGAKTVIIDTTNREMPGRSEELIALEPALQTNSLHNMISRKMKDGTQALADFNKGLAEIKADGTYEAILKRHGF